MIELNPVVQFKNMEKMFSDVKKESQENMKKLTKHMVRRVPRMVGKRVSEKYNIPASEIYPPMFKVKTDKVTKEKKKVAKLGRVKIHGETLDTLTFTWEGKSIPLTRFKVKPATMEALPEHPTIEPYDISFEILRGKRETLKADDSQFPNIYFGKRQYSNRRIFIANLSSGATPVYSHDKSRKITGRIGGLSVPAMVNDFDVERLYQKDINKELEAQIKKLRG
jgi:hypothetical protein